ncbi:hypothetical protein D3C87_1710020 [compost metagenome]
MLFVDKRVGFIHIPADGSGVEEDFRAHETGNAGRFGVPLVPTDQHADFGKFGIENPVAVGVLLAHRGVAGCKIEFLIVTRIVGNVHFAVFTQVGTVGVEYGGGVVVQAMRTFFEQRGDDHHAQFLR